MYEVCVHFCADFKKKWKLELNIFVCHIKKCVCNWMSKRLHRIQENIWTLEHEYGRNALKRVFFKNYLLLYVATTKTSVLIGAILK